MIGALIAILAALLLLVAGRSRREPVAGERDPLPPEPPMRVVATYPRQSRLAPPTHAHPMPRRWGRFVAALILGLILLSTAALAVALALVYRSTHPGNLVISPATISAQSVNAQIQVTLRNNTTDDPCDCSPLIIYALPRGFRQDWSKAIGLGQIERLDDNTYGGTIGPVNLPPGTHDIFAGQGYDTSLVWGNGTLTVTR